MHKLGEAGTCPACPGGTPDPQIPHTNVKGNLICVAAVEAEGGEGGGGGAGGGVRHSFCGKLFNDLGGSTGLYAHEIKVHQGTTCYLPNCQAPESDSREELKVHLESCDGAWCGIKGCRIPWHVRNRDRDEQNVIFDKRHPPWCDNDNCKEKAHRVVEAAPPSAVRKHALMTANPCHF